MANQRSSGAPSAPASLKEIKFVPMQYQHESIKGRRLPGWEDLNVTVLAEQLEVGGQHVREVLTGRRGVRLSLLRRIAENLELSLDGLMLRIDKARILDEDRRSYSRQNAFRNPADLRPRR